MPRIKVILEHGARRPFVPFDRRGFGEAGRVPVAQLLDEFEALRRANLEFLAGASLHSSQMALPGLHPELGPVTPDSSWPRGSFTTSTTSRKRFG